MRKNDVVVVGRWGKFDVERKEGEGILDGFEAYSGFKMSSKMLLFRSLLYIPTILFISSISL
jgi:hypothetical protein